MTETYADRAAALLGASGRHRIIEALAPEVKSWFADTVAQPIPEELQLILQRIDTYSERTRSTPWGPRNFQGSRSFASAKVSPLFADWPATSAVRLSVKRSPVCFIARFLSDHGCPEMQG